MGLESPSTYAEWYWKHSVDAEKDFDESLERAISPLMRNILVTSPAYSELPPSIKSFMDVITQPPTAGFGALLGRFSSEVADGTVSAMFSPALKATTRAAERKFLNTFIGVQEGSTLLFRNKIKADYWKDIHEGYGFSDAEAKWLYESSKPYPAINDVIRWARYNAEGSSPKETVWDKLDISPDDYDMWDWLTFQQLTTEQTHTAFRRRLLTDTEFDNRLSQLGWETSNFDIIKQVGYTFPNAMLLTQGNLQQGIENEQLLTDITKADIHPDYAQTYLDAILTKPASADIIAYQLRLDPKLPELDKHLRKIGIHPEYNELYKELAHPIPPLADIITMAVKEAFSPEIAERFGQYEDFPPEFEQWAMKKGLTSEWAERYWAAHWSLPSPQQGFEMLHRGVIDKTELNYLLRALDVMPFWRDKLTKIAYNPLTRVDVRRMYREGVLDKGEVYESYLEQGYAEKNARRMTEFTVKQALSLQSKFTTNDVLKAYTNRMIDRSDASGLLLDLGVRSDDVGYILNYQDYKRKWNFTEDKIRGIKNLYHKGVYDENQARAKLLGLNLPSEQVDLLFEQWWFEKQGEQAPTFTKAETLRFAKNGIITKERARIELERMGFDNEHVTIYMDAIT